MPNTNQTYTTVVEDGYNKWKTIEKFLIQGAIVAIIAFLTYFVEVGFPGLQLEYPQYAAIIAMISAIVVALINYLKHYKDTVVVIKDSKTGIILGTQRVK